MADSELKDLIATTTLAATDIMYVVVDPGGGGEADRKIEYEDLLAEIKTDAFPAWSTYVPTLTQSGTVTKTDTRVKTTQVGKFITVDVVLTVTGTGTATNQVTVTVPTAAAAGSTIGAGRIYDSSANLMYRAVAVLDSTTTVRLEPASSTTVGALGLVVFTAALASGDVVTFSGTYEAA